MLSFLSQQIVTFLEIRSSHETTADASPSRTWKDQHPSPALPAVRPVIGTSDIIDHREHF
jgi:hypothetical protein